ncbi:Ig-like domain-containing protein [Sinomicrobium sp.]
MRDIRLIVTSAILLFSALNASAQFTITNDFRGNGSPDIIIGDNAYLTSGVDDPVNAGWLRLTKATTNQKGYAYINKSFPSTLGVLVDFEYTMWRDQNDNTYNGADGFSIFLFDAAYGPGNFALGAYGGSLGYANSTNPNPDVPGLTGGYVGVGFDAYGNFVARSENKNGGSPDVSPNSIVLRGPTTSPNPRDLNTNRYLKGVTIRGNGSITDALNMQGNAREDVIDYNTRVNSRPSYSWFYRRVQIEITPTGTGRFNITVRWATSQGGEFTELISYETSDVPPELLKVGFAASTGAGFNYHEIRNILITTPGNIRANKLADKNVLRSVPGSGDENEITYILEVTNDTPAALTNIQVEDQLTDGIGNPIPPGMFHITNISHSGFTTTNLPTPTSGTPISSGNFNGSVGLPANSTGLITVKGFLDRQIPVGNLLQNTVTISNDEITDPDLANNTANVRTPVYAEGVDLVVEKYTDDECLDIANGNEFTLTVSNVGANNLQYSSTNEVKVIETLPAGTSISSISNSGWSRTNSGNTYTFTLNGNGTLRSGMSAPPIRFTIKSNSGYTNTADVELISEGGTDPTNIEPEENRGNNSSSVNIAPQPQAPVVDTPVYYCQGDTASPLTANADPGNTLIWYLNEGGTPSSIPFTPNTSVPGSTTYYVAQSNGNCESELTEIEVIVLETPQPGSITGGGEICSNTVPNLINSGDAGSGFGTISYRWEYSEDDGNTWTTITGADAATYQPSSIFKATKYRRITIATQAGGQSCESVPSNEVTVTVKNCVIITNPMLPSRVINRK